MLPYVLSGAGQLVSSAQVGIMKTSAVNLLTGCTCTLYATLTFMCGATTVASDDLSVTIDRTQLSSPSSTHEIYQNKVSSVVGDAQWTVFDVSFAITGISCYEPSISFTFVEHDFNSIAST